MVELLDHIARELALECVRLMKQPVLPARRPSWRTGAGNLEPCGASGWLSV